MGAAKGKFTYAEVEENEADLTKLRRWLRRIVWRDLYAGPLSATAALSTWAVALAAPLALSASRRFRDRH